MSIATLVTRGYGSFGSIAEVTTRGYIDLGAVTASITAGPWTEAQIVSGGQTIVITLQNDTWVASGATFNAQRQAIIDGITSAQTELLGWNTEVRDSEVVTSVARTSNTVVTITLSAAPSYDITADEVITATIPASALTGGVAVVAAPTVGITADVIVSGIQGGGKRRSSPFDKMGQLTTTKKARIRQEDEEVVSILLRAITAIENDRTG